MRTALVTVTLAVVAATAYPQQQDNGGIDRNFVCSVFGGKSCEFSNTSSEEPPCECVPPSQCNLPKDDTIAGTNIVDLRAVNACPNIQEICCQLDLRKSKDSGVTATPSPDPVPRPQAGPITCGQRNERGVGARQDLPSDEAEFGEFPWMTAVIELNQGKVPGETKGSYLCGGAIITPFAVLTVAHRVRGKSADGVMARGGDWDLQNSVESYIHQDRAVAQIIVHPNYRHQHPFNNNIALLILRDPFNLDLHIAPACLPAQGEIINESDCFISGWGVEEFNDTAMFSSRMKKVQLPTVPRDVCNKALRKTRLGPNFNLDISYICAGGEAGKDACRGDGGSPLVCSLPGPDGRYQIVGAVSWGIGCKLPIPAAYTNVAIFRDWIDETLRSMDIDTTPYEFLS